MFPPGCTVFVNGKHPLSPGTYNGIRELLDLRTSTSTRFYLKFLRLFSKKKKKDTPESFILLFFTKKVSMFS